MSRAKNSGRSLSEDDAAVVKGMLVRGDRQHDIAAWFGVNGGRIGEISKGKKFEDIGPSTRDLPPAGPYLSGEAADRLLGELKRVRSKIRILLDLNLSHDDFQHICLTLLAQLDAAIDRASRRQ